MQIGAAAYEVGVFAERLKHAEMRVNFKLSAGNLYLRPGKPGPNR